MIELSRNITFGQYVNNSSVLTRLDPRAKLLCALLLIALFPLSMSCAVSGSSSSFWAFSTFSRLSFTIHPRNTPA